MGVRALQALTLANFSLSLTLGANARAQSDVAVPEGPSAAPTSDSSLSESSVSDSSGSVSSAAPAPARPAAPIETPEEAGAAAPLASESPSASESPLASEAPPAFESPPVVIPPDLSAGSPAPPVRPESANDPLAAAERAMLQIDYERSLALAQDALARGHLDPAGLRKAYEVLAFSAAQLDRHDVAQPAFLRLFALDPNIDFTRRLAPARRTSAMTARGYWMRQGTGMSLSAHFDRSRGQLVVTGVDPLAWWTSLEVWYRSPGGAYTRRILQARPVQSVEVNVPPLGVVETYVAALDERGNVVATFGSAEAPVVLTPSAEDRYVLDREIRSGEPGSFGRHLEELGAETNIHGYTSLEFGPRTEHDGATFDLRHATIFVTAKLARTATMEVGLDLQHLAASRQDLSVPHAFLDLELQEWLVIRPGFFEAPIGAFNEYLYPDFLRTTALTPLFASAVVPALWSEVGVQVRGKLPVVPQADLTYAVFVSNGLEQRDDAAGDGQIAEGGALRDMRFNVRDQHNSDKAVGGRLGLVTDAWDVGVSGYTGRYTVDADRRLTLADVDVSYKSRWLTVRAEGALAIQEISGGRRTREGAYVLASSRAEAHLEPYVQYDVVRDGAVVHRLLLGNGLYPFPEIPTLRSLRLKTEVGFSAREDEDAGLVWFTQLVSGF